MISLRRCIRFAVMVVVPLICGLGATQTVAQQSGPESEPLLQPVPAQPSVLQSVPDQPNLLQPLPGQQPSPQQQPAAEQPAAAQPVAAQPAPEQPATEQQPAAEHAPEQPAPEQPTPLQPAPAQPTGEQPAPPQRSPEQPTLLQPAPAQPASEQPAAVQPMPAPPALQSPAVEHPAAVPPAPGQPVASPPYPSRPIRVVVPFATGGLVDRSMRALAPRMGQALGQPVVVENKAGADGIAGVAEVTHSEPDGYTLLFGVETMVLSPYLYRNPGFDPVRDLQPVSEVLSVPVALFVQPDMLVNSLKELAAYSRVKPGMLTAGSAEVGTAASLCLEMFLWLSGADLTHKTYPSADAAISDFVGGKTQVIALSTAAARPYVRSGQMKPLAVAAPQRSWMLPDVPTTAEAGYAALEFSTWMGLLGPAGLSSDVVDRVREAAVQALNDPANAKLFAEQGLDILGTTPADFGRFISSETAKFGKAVSMAGIRPE